MSPLFYCRLALSLQGLIFIILQPSSPAWHCGVRILLQIALMASEIVALRKQNSELHLLAQSQTQVGSHRHQLSADHKVARRCCRCNAKFRDVAFASLNTAPVYQQRPLKFCIQITVLVGSQHTAYLQRATRSNLLLTTIITSKQISTHWLILTRSSTTAL